MDAAGERLRGIPLGARLRGWGRAAYHAAWLLQTGGRGLSCTLPSGELIRVLPEHRYLSWNPMEYAAFRAAVTPGMIALDIGANVGAYTVLLAHWVGKTGRVYAFEPSGPAFHGLVRHVSLNVQGDVVRPLAVAVSDREGSGNLIVAATAGESRLADRPSPGSAVTVAVTTVDHFCAREGVQPSFIKVDVEGEELAVLRGARETIRRADDRLALFVELHPSIWALNGTARGEIQAELERQGLRMEPLSGRDPWSVEGMAVRLVRC
jgi:FkbM family methyltransferase